MRCGEQPVFGGGIRLRCELALEIDGPLAIGLRGQNGNREVPKRGTAVGEPLLQAIAGLGAAPGGDESRTVPPAPRGTRAVPLHGVVGPAAHG